MSVPASQLHQEWCNTIIIVFTFFGDNESCKKYCMICPTTNLSRPPFGSWNWRCINDEFILLFVKDCSCLQPRNVRAMTYFSLGVAPMNIVLERLRKPFCPLLLVCKKVQRLTEHGEMKRSRRLTLMEKEPVVVWLHDKMEEFPRIRLPAPRQLFHPVVLDLFRSPFIEFVGISVLGVLIHKIGVILKLLINRHIVPIDFGHLSFIKITVVSLFNKLRGSNFVLHAASDFFRLRRCHWDCFYIPESIYN